MKRIWILGFGLVLILVLGLSAAQSYVLNLKVKVMTANVRSEPDVSSSVIKQLPQGTLLESRQKIGDWYEISITDDTGKSLSGYINSSVVDIVGGEKKEIAPPVPVIQPQRTTEPPPVVNQTPVQPPKWEFSTAVSFALSRISYEEQANTVTTISVPLRLGYYLTKSIELEPEVVFARLSQEDTSATNVSAMANVLYNFSLGRQMSAFVLGGAGVILSSATIENVSESRMNFGFNGGAGLRWLISNSVALRAEYRLVYYTDQPEDLESKVTYMDHRGFLGISVFF